MIQRHVFISGKVQGVGFRASVLLEAQKYPTLMGFVRNLVDGRVEAVIAGEESDVLSLASWCKHGPRAARVSGIEVKEEDLDPSLEKFGIL